MKDFNLLYESEKDSPVSSASSLETEKPAWAMPLKHTNYESLVDRTVFRQRYLTVIMDEAQSFRNRGPRHSCALVLMGLSKMRMPMTATPLQTSTKVRLRYDSIFYDEQCMGTGSCLHGEVGRYPVFFHR